MLRGVAQGVALPTRPTRTVAVKPVAPKTGVRVEIAAMLAVVPAVTLAAPAFAAEELEVDSAIDTVVNVVRAGGEVVKSTLTTVEAGFDVLKEGFDYAAPAIERAYTAASPVVEQVVKATADAAGPVIRSALPAIQGAVEGSGINSQSVSSATSLVTSTASSAATTASPFVTKFLQFVASSDPLTLGEYALGLVAFTYVAPAILGVVGGSFRGYAGELAPAAALDLLVNEGNVVLVDIRTSKEKENSGIPDLPSAANGKTLEVEYAITEDKKLRGQLRDPSAIEAQVTALQVAALKKIGKGTKLVLLDRYGPAARQVAKELARKGYGKVFVIQGGFDGRSGWVSSKLQIKPAAILTTSSPSSLAKTVFTRGSKALPAPRSS